MAEDENLKDGFNLIGYSQGALITRGYVERCNNPPVYNLITWSGPHGGQFGVPGINITWIDEIVTNEPYANWVQQDISFAGYWRDSFNLTAFLDYAIFLPDINNLREVKNQTYKQNLLSLSNFVMTYSDVDLVVQPAESAWFWVYQNDSHSQVITLAEQPLYIEDWLGLRALNETGRLHMYTMPCPHNGIPFPGCQIYFNEFTLPYLNNTLSQTNPNQKDVLH